MNAHTPPDRRHHNRTEHERRLYWARLHASEGCEASARELEELLDELENPASNEPVPIRFCLTDEQLLAIGRGHRKFNRENRL